MILIGVKDLCANKFSQVYWQDDEISLLKRGLSNYLKSGNRNDPMVTNPDDFRIYKLAEVNNVTGEVTACEVQPLFYLSELVQKSEMTPVLGVGMPSNHE